MASPVLRLVRRCAKQSVKLAAKEGGKSGDQQVFRTVVQHYHVSLSPLEQSVCASSSTLLQKHSCLPHNLRQHVHRFHSASCGPVLQKHTWVPHDQVPNKFVTKKDIQGPTLHNEEAAREFVYALSQQERERLHTEMNKFLEAKESETSQRLTLKQLAVVCLHQALPFCVFGFLDNFVMIVAGEYIEYKCRTFLYISTMAAAGLGNTISDVVGIAFSSYVENFVAKIGFRAPRLTPSQVDLPSTRRAVVLGKVLGVTMGCLLGMFPLLFFDNDDDEEDKHQDDSTHTDMDSKKQESPLSHTRTPRQ